MPSSCWNIAKVSYCKIWWLYWLTTIRSDVSSLARNCTITTFSPDCFWRYRRASKAALNTRTNEGNGGHFLIDDFTGLPIASLKMSYIILFVSVGLSSNIWTKVDKNKYFFAQCSGLRFIISLYSGDFPYPPHLCF